MLSTTIEKSTLSDEASYSILTKTECLFAAIWHNPQGVVPTEAIAQYYQTEVKTINGLLIQHWEEFKQELAVQDSGAYEWTPRAAIRLGMLLDSPVATEVRSLALNVIEAHKKKDLRSSVAFLLENARFVEWSDRSIAEILKCSPTTVGNVRKELEANNKVVKFERRKHTRNGKTVERENKGSGSLMSIDGHEEDSNTDSFVVTPTPKVKVTSPSNPFCGQEGEVVGDLKNGIHLLVKFAGSEKSELVPIKDLDAPSVSINPTPIRTPAPRTYTEEELQQAIARAIEESKIGDISEAREKAEAQVRDELEAQRAIALARQAENIKLQQKIDELESLRKLEDENRQLQQEIESLKAQLQQQAMKQWENPLNKDAERFLNAEVKAALTYDLRAIAVEPPLDKAEECLRLMGMALNNLAKALNHTQAMQAAAILLSQESDISSQLSAVSCEEATDSCPQPPIPTVTEALAQIKSVLTKLDCTWSDFWAVAEPFQPIKEEYWHGLSREEKSQIRQMLEKSKQIEIGSRVSHADEYSTLYKIQGTVTGFESGMFLVHWDTVERPLFQHRYEPQELRIV